MAPRLVALAVLTALAAASLAPSTPRQPDPPATGGWLSIGIVGGLTIAALTLVIIAGLRYRPPRVPSPGYRRRRGIPWLTAVILLIVVAIAGAVTIFAPWLLIALAAVPLAIMATRRPHRRTRTPEPVAHQGDPRHDVAEPTRFLPLADSAIIRCYAAMEDALAEHPLAAPRPADSPSEVVSRASAAGVLRTPAAWRLVELFDEARFSPHPMAVHDHTEAELSLRAVLAELSETR